MFIIRKKNSPKICQSEKKKKMNDFRHENNKKGDETYGEKDYRDKYEEKDNPEVDV